MDLLEQLGDSHFLKVAETGANLSQVAVITMGSSPPGTSYNEAGVGLPFYQGVRDFGRRYPSLRVWTTDPRRTAEPNDSLLSVRAPVGRLNRALDECCIGRGLASVRSDRWPSTIYYALRNAGHVWDRYEQEGTVFGAVNRKDLATTHVPWPKESALPELEDKLATIDARVLSLITEDNKLAELRDTLLPELLSGRIRVSEARETIEDTTDAELPHG